MVLGWSVLVVIGICYLANILSAGPSIIFKYLDKQIDERVNQRVDAVIAEKGKELLALQRRLEDKEKHLLVIKEVRKFPRSELPPFGVGGA